MVAQSWVELVDSQSRHLQNGKGSSRSEDSTTHRNVTKLGLEGLVSDSLLILNVSTAELVVVVVRHNITRKQGELCERVSVGQFDEQDL